MAAAPERQVYRRTTSGGKWTSGTTYTEVNSSTTPR
eukprot:CAMPEP_0174995900 /NCGR_PEP_ID=MMETSP0005-20121125/95_1 /TAXON_ID=420556 /ORGANISM="Ochromonas sp., Strain CCMP1393" /LENGTH=35 /DNA_ID= /DNA_START= /DNA_END= /DNA_ORIENTATION=